MMFSCDRCGYKTNIKCNLISHLQRQNWCVPNINNISPLIQLDNYIVKVESPYTCDICNKSFTCRTTLPRHKKRCLEKNKELIELRRENYNLNVYNVLYETS